MKVGFIGLGSMGMPIAVNIARAGHNLAVWNRSPRSLESFGELKPRVANCAGEAAQGAELIVTMLSDDAAVEDVVLGGMLDAIPEGAVHVCTSTLSVAAARRLTEAHAARGRAYVAAPVFGRPDAAAAAKLWVVAAGPAEALRRARPVLEAISRGISEFGPEPWRANLVKLGNNLMLAVLIETFGEIYGLMKKGGIEPKAFLEAVNSLFQSPVYANYGALIAEGRLTPAGFKASLGLKDVRLASAAADELAVPLPLADLVRMGFLTAMAEGRGDEDWAALAAVAAARGGVRLG
ncbi:MAG: NAD(P)-dependent oxidoreductase [Acetobacteraceae bacterium]|nr:NAD(P)-dependent oxidoreductase [Acetobacteraceae bacterium]